VPHFHVEDGELFALARWRRDRKPADGGAVDGCTILATHTNQLVKAGA
jgi:putative SOS response-associated peptidase YedK